LLQNSISSSFQDIAL